MLEANLHSLTPKSIFNLPRPALAAELAAAQFSPVHATNLFRHLYQESRPCFASATAIGSRLQQHCQNVYTTSLPKFGGCQRSAYDGSIKFRVDLADGAAVETVLMPEARRLTICLSTQVGCAQACSFCHTGRMGLKRQLSTAEIVGQVIEAQSWLRANPEWLISLRLPPAQRISNVVFMGMGEPLDNYAALGPALEIMRDPCGLGLATRRISVSTAGHLDGLRLLAAEFPGVNIALSLHATTDAERSKIMPINRRWPLASLLSFFQNHYSGPGGKRMLLVQYTVIAGVNDSAEDAERLMTLLAGLPVKINLIPLNEIAVSRLRSPSDERLQAFRQLLYAGGFRVMVRYSKGQDIAAACGQLVL